MHAVSLREGKVASRKSARFSLLLQDSRPWPQLPRLPGKPRGAEETFFSTTTTEIELSKFITKKVEHSSAC